MKKFFGSALILFLMFFAVGAAAAPMQDLGAFSNVRTSAARMPFYKDKQLEYYLRSDSLALRGRQIDAEWPLIDVVRKGISVDVVSRSDSSKDIYPLDSTLETVSAYWANRAYSEGLVLSEDAALDQVNRTAAGKKKVFLRSPAMDLNGVGFTADFSRKLVTVTSEVEIVLRNEGARSLGSGLDVVKETGSSDKEKNKTSVTRVFCNLLTLDMQNNLITLDGNVRVFDAAGTITCDRLEIELRDKSAGNKKQTDAAGDLVGSSGKQLSKVRFIGKVHAVRKLDEDEAANGEQYADADLMIYSADENTLELTGSRPRLVRGKDYAEAERILALTDKKIIQFFDQCAFEVTREHADGKKTPADQISSDYADWNQPENRIRLQGNAKLKSPSEKADMRADSLEILLPEEKSGKKSSSALQGAGRPDKIVASGNVQLRRDNNGVVESASAGKMTYLSVDDKIDMEKSPELHRGNDVIKGGFITYLVEEERMIIERFSRITLSAETVGQGAAAGAQKDGAQSGGPVTVDSKAADLNYGGNVIGFSGQVKVQGRGMKLDSEKLDIFLSDDQTTKTQKKSDQDPLAGSKKPIRAEAVGKVRAGDKTGTLDCDKLDVWFGDKAQPGKTDIEKIAASGNVRLQSKPEKNGEAVQGPTLLGNSADGTTSLVAKRGVMDMLTHEADFYEDVVVSDTAVRLECQHLKAVARPTSAPVPDLQSFKARDEFPDRLAVGDDRELVQIIGRDDVRIFRTLADGEVQRAKGDLAVYTVRDRKVELTCKPPRKPQAVTADGGMIGDKVTIALDTEEVFVKNGDVLARTDGE